MILVDTSVIVDLWRSPRERVQDALPTEPVAICGVTLAELLQGARTPGDREVIFQRLSGFARVPLGEAIWELFGDNLATLRRAGISVPFPDALIATVALRDNLSVWTTDRHFHRMREALPSMKFFTPPSE